MAVFCVGLVVLAAVAVGILALSHGNNGTSRNGGPAPTSSTPTTGQGAEDPGSGHSRRSKSPKSSESPQNGDGQDVPDGQAGEGAQGTTQPGEGQVGQVPPSGDVQPQGPQPLNGLPFNGSTTTQPVPQTTQNLPGPMVQGGVAPSQDGARQDSRTVVFVWKWGTTG